MSSVQAAHIGWVSLDAIKKLEQGTYFCFLPVGPLTQPRSTLVAYGPPSAAGIISLGCKASGTSAPISKSTPEFRSVKYTWPWGSDHLSTSSYFGISSLLTGIVGLESTSGRRMATFSSRSNTTRSLTRAVSLLLSMVVSFSLVFLPTTIRRSIRLSRQKVGLEPLSSNA